MLNAATKMDPDAAGGTGCTTGFRDGQEERFGNATSNRNHIEEKRRKLAVLHEPLQTIIGPHSSLDGRQCQHARSPDTPGTSEQGRFAHPVSTRTVSNRASRVA